VLLVDAGAGTKALAHGMLLAFAVAIALRRRGPLPALAVTYVVFVVAASRPALSEALFGPYFAVILMNYSAGANTDGRAFAACAALGTIGLFVVLQVDTVEDTPGEWLFGATMLLGGPLLVGQLLRSRSRLNRALRDKAARLERERTEAAERAALDERARIASELHDVVAHALGAMVVQGAGARRLVRRDPAAAEAAFATVEATGREALGELRRLLGVLRKADADLALAPQPSLAHLGDLARRTGAAGLPVELDVQGDPSQLPPGVDLTAYRVVQEALGSAREQGAAERARVRIRYGPAWLEIAVDDDGATPANGGAGRELPGVRERLTLHGGELTVTARRGGGHRVIARLPVEAAR
jgi:signal transduction histidine kinase